MSEENKKKINLSWLNIGNNNSSKEEEIIEVLDIPETPEDTKTVEVEKKVKSNKISLAWMKEKRSDNSVKKIDKETIQTNTEEKKDSSPESEQKTEISLNDKKVEVRLEKEEEPKEEESTKLVDDKDIKKTGVSLKKATNSTNIDWKVEVKETAKIDGESKGDKESLFSNYTSDFEKDEWTIVDKIKELWKKPQTRVLLVVFLIVSTILWIAGLFIVDPKRHSISHYKAVLMGFYNKQTGNNTYIETNTEIKNTQVAEIAWEDKKVDRNGYRISIKTKTNTDGVKMYKFNNSEFDTITKLNNEIDIEIKKIKTNKVKDFLLTPSINRSSKDEDQSKEEQNEASAESKTAPKKSALQLLQERK